MAAMRLDIGTRLDRYEILGLVSTGGMGEVYRARDERLRRDVAIKILPAQAESGAGGAARFAEEARAVAALNHPNICTVYDFGSDAQQQYLVMELVDGEPLSARIIGRPLSAADTIAIGLQVVDALQCAHTAGIVHGDIKPANILLAPSGIVKLVDFGIARRLERYADAITTDLGGTTTRHATDALVGTIPYMSPEQLRGEAIDARSDLFSLGVVLFEMATGYTPFAAGNVGATIEAIFTKAPKPPSHSNPGCPPVLDEIVGRLLQKRRSDRYDAALDVRAALEAAGHDVAALGLRIFDARFGAVAPRRRSVAVLPFRDLSANRDQGYFCDGVVEELITAFTRVPDLQVPSRLSTFAAAAGNDSPRVIAERLGVQAILEGSVRRSASRLRVDVRLTSVADGKTLWVEQLNGQVEDVLTVQEQIAQSTLNGLRLNLLLEGPLMRKHSADVDAYNFYLMSREHWNTRTLDGIEKSIALAGRAVERDHNYALAHASMALSYLTLATYTPTPPAPLAERGRAAAAIAVGLDPDLSDAHVALGLFHLCFSWNWQQADEELSRAIQLNPNDATAHQMYSLWHLAMRHDREALALIRHAERLEPASLIVSSQVGWILYFLGRHDEAVVHLTTTVARDRLFWRGYLNLAWCFAATSDTARALDAIGTALALNEYPLLHAVKAYVYAAAGDQKQRRPF